MPNESVKPEKEGFYFVELAGNRYTGKECFFDVLYYDHGDGWQDYEHGWLEPVWFDTKIISYTELPKRHGT